MFGVFCCFLISVLPWHLCILVYRQKGMIVSHKVSHKDGLHMWGFFGELGDMKSITLSQTYFYALFSSFLVKQSPRVIKYCGVRYSSTTK